MNMVHNQVSGDHVDFDVDKGMDMSEDKDDIPLDSKKRKKRVVTSRSPWWDHFHKFYCEKDKVQKAKCKYCSREIKPEPKVHGTRPLKNHFESCKNKPYDVSINQKRLSFQSIRLGEKEAPLVNWRFDQEKIREALSYMLVVDELPFKTVENSGFRHFMSVTCPMFAIPSRRTITKDIFHMYVNERAKLKSFIKNHAQRVCITTDTWTSIQKVNYMCLTAHFIDDDWKLHKRILNFFPIIGHKNEEVSKGVEKCFLEWGIDRIFTITVDNASSNDGAMVYLKKKLENWGQNILGGKYVHMRCIAHIINLVVQDGLKGKDEHEAISRIRGAIKYVRNSPARWNSTYLMLEAATCLKRAFDAYEDIDLAYKTDLSKKPFESDWDRAKMLLKFLKHFYNLTLCISCSSYVTSNIVFHEICEVDLLLRRWFRSDDVELSDMARK
ncbi:UNVERIFIED_CONTAM: putative AC transposase [Sesamum indicum]